MSTMQQPEVMVIITPVAAGEVRKFMEAEKVESEVLMWYVIIHLTFVASAVLMGVLDRLTAGSHRHDKG